MVRMYVCADELKLHPVQLESCCRTSPDTFQKRLSQSIQSSITKRDTNYRVAVSATEKRLQMLCLTRIHHHTLFKIKKN